ncbi:MAG: C40 family peptidase [Ignavibacteriales bacterium]|nr:C40 family peptidase [Ignavibacteriales bacterium]MCC6637983.1 C40 family peptidase [Ignavibacteriaceae bacterium]
MVLNKKLLIFLTAAGGVLLLSGCSSLMSAPGRGKDVEENKPGAQIVDEARFPADTVPTPPVVTKTEEETVRIPDQTGGDEDTEFYDLPVNETISMEDIIMDNVQNLDEKQKANRDILIMNIIKYLGTPYVWGGNTRSGLDCSGFTKLVFTEAFGLSMYRTARDQFNQGEVVPTFNDLRFGDLVFFDTRPSARPGHVGIYLGNRLFAHASTKQGVIVSSFDTKYYTDKYMGGRRFKKLFEEE